MIVTLTEEEGELVLLAMEYFRHNGLQDHDTVDRLDISDKLEAIAETVRKEKIMEQHDMSWKMIVDFIFAFFPDWETCHTLIEAANERFPEGASVGEFGKWLSHNMP